MTLKEIIRKKVLGIAGGLVSEEGSGAEERISLINDSERITRQKIQEYNVWYIGDGDELLNYYTNQTMFNYNYEPYYSRNKKGYFWSVSATENDIKRTHSGQARNIVDTLVGITRFPLIKVTEHGGTKNKVNENLQKILRDCKMKSIYKDEQMPMTLVEGWGCYKINWDKDVSDYPYPVYYRAENVDFIYKAKKIVGIIYKDWYTDGKNRKYLLLEIRRTHMQGGVPCLVIENEIYKVLDGMKDYVKKVEPEEIKNEVPELADIQEYIEIGPTRVLFSEPCMFYKNPDGNQSGPGRSIFSGKIDLLDDLDESLSQATNTVRRSTTIEYFNSEYLERDPATGLPKQPHSYDRKYSVYAGQRGSSGDVNTNDPVQVTQPNLNFEQYDSHSISVLSQLLTGIMSPATLGIDIAKKDNALAQREKEKVTIFTRNGIIDSETEILYGLCNQLLMAYEFMTTGKITVTEYNISIKFSEFADDSYENKLEKLGAAYDSQQISDDMYMSKLYGDTLSDDEYEKELKWLKENHTKPRTDGMTGFNGDGFNEEGVNPAEVASLIK